MLQKWPLEEGDFKDLDTGFSDRVRKRPIVKIMRFADYNHDGNATEFFLQTGVEPCFKVDGVVVGVTRQNPKLHAFGSMTNPNKPLILQKTEWEALRKSPGPLEVLDWPCGDHGSEVEIDIDLAP